MGPSKSSDANSAKKGATPKSAMKKANAKASSADKSSKKQIEELPSKENELTNDTGVDVNAGSDSGTADTVDTLTSEKSSDLSGNLSGRALSDQALSGQKEASKPSYKKSKAKLVGRPSTRTVTKRKSQAQSNPATEPESLAFSEALLEVDSPSANAAEKAAPPMIDSQTSKPTAPSFGLSTSQLPVNQSSDRIAIFIDGSNLFYAASHLNIEVDYRRLLSSLVRGRRLLRAYFYTGVDPQNEKQRGFLLWLNRHGHRVVSKELTHLPDGSRKANMHVEMAVDMMRIAEYCPNITLLGGDGNLAYALQVLSQRGTFIEVVSLQSMTSDSLIDLADSYTDLADLRDNINR